MLEILGGTKMYIYEYERVNSDISGNKYGIEAYKQIINRRAAEGWRYIGFIPAVQRGTGHIEELDLIFERQQ